jgi:hypothetical protein
MINPLTIQTKFAKGDFSILSSSKEYRLWYTIVEFKGTESIYDSLTLQHYYEQFIVFTSDLIKGLFNKNPSKIELVGLWWIMTPHTKDQFNKSATLSFQQPMRDSPIP